MKYKNLSVGITMPSCVDYSNARFDLTVELEDGDDVNINEIVAKLKTEVANHVSGGSVRYYQKALDILFYPSNKELMATIVEECKQLKHEIKIAEKELLTRQTQLKDFKSLLENLDKLNEICDYYEITHEFWNTISKIIEKDKELSSATLQTDNDELILDVDAEKGGLSF